MVNLESNFLGQNAWFVHTFLEATFFTNLEAVPFMSALAMGFPWRKKSVQDGRSIHVVLECGIVDLLCFIRNFRLMMQHEHEHIVMIDCAYIYIYITHMYMTVYVWCVSLNHVSVFVIFLSYILGRAYLEYLHSLCSKHTEKELHIWHYDSDFIGGSGWLIFEKMGGLAILVVWQLGWLNLIQVSGSTTTAFNIQKYLENQRFPDRTMIYH